MSDQQHGDIPSYPRRPDGSDQRGYDQGGYPQQGYGQQGYDDGRWQASSGPRLFPFPSWTTRTRGGSTVTVGGCCLPLPIGCLATTLTVGAIATTRVVRRLRG